MDQETARIAKRFATRLKKIYAPERIILFGSRARGDHFKTSDFDFIIVSKKFSGIPFIERPCSLYDYWDATVDLEAICYTPEEFARKAKEHGIVKNAKQEGIELT